MFDMFLFCFETLMY